MSARAPRSFNSAQQRSNLLRERVRDVCTQIGYGDFGYGMEQFAKRAVELGERAGMRIWRSDHATPEQLAVNGLKTLLGIRFYRGKPTGTNEHWVLDLWELVLHEHFHGPVKVVRPEPEPEEPVAASGVEVLAVKRDAKKRATLAALPMRLMEAYLGRDDEGFMALLLEIERLGEEA